MYQSNDARFSQAEHLLNTWLIMLIRLKLTNYFSFKLHVGQGIPVYLKLILKKIPDSSSRQWKIQGGAEEDIHGMFKRNLKESNNSNILFSKNFYTEILNI